MKINMRSLAAITAAVAVAVFLGTLAGVLVAVEIIENRIERSVSEFVTELDAGTSQDPDAPLCDDPDVARYSAACPQYEGP